MQKMNCSHTWAFLTMPAWVLEYRTGFLHIRLMLIDASTKAKQLDHFIQLNEEARSDTEW